MKDKQRSMSPWRSDPTIAAWRSCCVATILGTGLVPSNRRPRAGRKCKDVQRAHVSSSCHSWRCGSPDVREMLTCRMRSTSTAAKAARHMLRQLRKLPDGEENAENEAPFIEIEKLHRQG